MLLNRRFTTIDLSINCVCPAVSSRDFGCFFIDTIEHAHLASGPFLTRPPSFWTPFLSPFGHYNTFSSHQSSDRCHMSITQSFTFAVECIALHVFEDVCNDHCSLRLLLFLFFCYSKLTLPVFSAILVPFSFWRFAVLVPWDFECQISRSKTEPARSKYGRCTVCKADTPYHWSSTTLRVHAILAANWWGH